MDAFDVRFGVVGVGALDLEQLFARRGGLSTALAGVSEDSFIIFYNRGDRLVHFVISTMASIIYYSA